ncbi:phage tail sheath protein [Desulfosarcina variabilis str. Montpellier]|uniref:phage tail sheath family protein n=1 Tax=Desulfosarcina variabilis TaxID=2300 RepID=UPI003AFB5E66
MPVATTYPGVYIEEIPSGVRTITGVATSITAFLGRTIMGPANEPVTINSFGDFERQFGGLGVNYPLSYAVRDFYLNGGSQAIIVRLYNDSDTNGDANASLTVDDLALTAASPGQWGKKLRATIDVEVSDEIRTRLGLSDTDALFNLTIRLGSSVEKFLNLTVTDNAGRVDRVLKARSSLVAWKGAWPSAVPAMGKVATARGRLKDLNDALNAIAVDDAAVTAAREAYETAKQDLDDDATKAEIQLAAALAAVPRVADDIAAAQEALLEAEGAMGGSDGKALDQPVYEGSKEDKTGIYALDKADLFNLLCIPPDTRGGDIPPVVYQTAMAYCVARRAMLLVDSPAAWTANKDTAAASAKKGLSALGLSGEAARNAALYFPRVLETDPLRDGQIEAFVPCGIIAGIMARTDTARGVWKAPAGLDAAIIGIQGLNVPLNDAENGMLNPLGINCMRVFPVNGRVVWGARTLRGADQLADEYKYVPVRRLALYIEESLYRGIQWVVFEPNDEPLWSQIRLNVGAFMHNLFRQGAFQGTTQQDAYFVKCDKETTTQNDINLGIVNIVVGFAPLKPAEFVIIKIQQIAGQIQT